MSPDQSDQRRFHRMSAAYRVETAGEAAPVEPAKVLHDISSYGARIRSGKAVPPGETVEIRFPDIDPDFIARGSVVWCEARTESEFDLGLRMDGDATDYEQLFTRVQEIEKYRKTAEDLRGQSVPPDEAARQWRLKFGDAVEPRR